MDKEFLKTGLTLAEVEKRREKFGSNKLAEQRKFSVLKLFFSQFTSPLIYVLFFAALVTFFLRDFNDMAIILLAVVVNTVLGFYQEYKAAKSLEALSAMLESWTEVIREGKRRKIHAEELVPGDVVVLTMGGKIPADGILIKAKDFTANEAVLTGESLPVDKKNLNDQDLGKLLKEGFSGKWLKQNQVFMGTSVVSGLGRMIVTEIGDKTKMGEIAVSLSSQEEGKTPLQKQLLHFSKILAILVGVISLIILFAGIITGKAFAEIFPTSVAIAVAAIPEGLVVTLTVILALGMQRILKRKALVRKLLAAETLGGVTVICADKTGTLTQGKMQVVQTEFEDKTLGILGVLLCNDLRDPLEVAMWDWGKEKLKGLKQTVSNTKSVEEILKIYARLNSKPFSPESKLILTLHKSPKKKKNLLFISGAPEVVLANCQLSPAKRKEWKKTFAQYGREGLRLVGLAHKFTGEGKKEVGYKDAREAEWLGIVVFEDPVRRGITEAFRTTQKAGIKIKVITGDYLETAKAVLHKLHILDGQLKPEQMMLGEELEKLSPEALKNKVNQIVLFARTSPQQKLRIVQALQERGEVVAMTGDGVNDAPALKKADVGIVVSTASDVSKETADMVLLDDNFSTIVDAVEEGRGIFDNIRKVILYLLSDSFSEVILVLGSIILGIPLPLTAAQILWINLITDGFPSLALTAEPKDKDLMSAKPRSPKDHLMDAEVKVLISVISIVTGLMTLFVFIWLFKENLMPLEKMRTIIFAMLGVDSLIYVFSCRSLRRPIWHDNFFKNPWLLAAVAGGFGLQLIALYIPFFQNFLGTMALSWREWGWTMLAAAIVIVIIEGIKWGFLHQKHQEEI